MFVLTLNKNISRRKKAFIAVFLTVLAAALIFCALISRKGEGFAEIDGRMLDMKVTCDDDIERISAFFNISTDKSTIIRQTVRIPVKFNKLYEKYNSLQKNIGTDLSDYRGRECVKYTADIISETNDTIMTLLVCDGIFIGGDISSKEFDGKIYAIV